jgi:hypothetical protein
MDFRSTAFTLIPGALEDKKRCEYECDCFFPTALTLVNAEQREDDKCLMKAQRDMV